MKRILLLLAVTFACFTLLTSTAEARRFGGGSSIGKQRTMSAPVQKAPAAAPAAAPNAATPAGAPAPAPTGNRWLGPLAGLAIGAGLGALFMGGGMSGMGGAIGSVLMIAAVIFGVMMLIAMFRRKQEPAVQYAGHANTYGQPEPQTYAGSAAPAAAPVAAANIPADFPLEAFLRSAKMSFIRLQAANDRKDLNDVREYTTPEMYAEVSMQFSERGNAAQTTEVVNVNAELLEVATENDLAIASVRMTGQLRENNGPAESFDEIWHVQKNLKDSKSVWLLAGIQQIN
ncbi:MAG TPA: Tim44-like domain-containing protein [Gallionellaceae bacterium]|nr:Tim44-like domain-containing protein [Gallionellaceae bacterium]